MSPGFVHLRLRTEFSLVDGLVRVKPLIKAVAERGMPAVAVTDHVNLFAMVKFQKAAEAGGIKPVFGADIWLEQELDGEPPRLMTLLIQNEQGYQNLTEIISIAYLSHQHLSLPVVTREVLQRHAEGLIALSGGRMGEVGQALLGGHQGIAQRLLKELMTIFPERFYLEVHRTGRENDEEYLHRAVDLAAMAKCPVVATNDVRFINSEDFEAHEARVCIHDSRVLDDPRRPRLYSDQQYLKSATEMQELFADLPEALENSVEIARRCNLHIKLGESFLPNYPVPEGMTLESFFAQESLQGLDRRLNKLLDQTDPQYKEQRKVYLERLQFELDVINQMGFPGYFLIVMDFIRWAKNNGVPVGPGRGSGAGSLVAYALEITDLDPIAYDLLFERFLNPERVSMPDFDVDFCMDGRDSVIDYVADTYGRNAVSQIITFGTMAAKAVVRDVARVQGKSYGLADRLSKMIPFEPGMTLNKALEQEEALRDFITEDSEAGEIMEMAFKLEGITRNVGKHAGGVVIAPTKLTDFSPLYCDETGANLVTQFDKDDVEQVGLVKFDFLGLRTLTIVDWAVDIINRQRKVENEALLDITQIPLDDPEVFYLLQKAQTTAVFQLESRGMKDLIKRLLPNCFEDIVALVALFRPGPLQSGMVDDFINRKHGRQSIEYPHPDLEPVLKNTYGVILYQEQVMQIAQVLANYSLGQADMLRRAMGKKKPEEMAKQRQIFNTGAVANNIDEQTATLIFDLMEKFAGYGFNKSHSAAYALVSYQTAWLKTHYPAPFMAAVLSADMDNTDKVVMLIEDCRSIGLSTLPPDVNYSEYKFTVNSSNDVIYGLGAIKGVGEGPVAAIVDARKEAGAFKDLFEFCRRVDFKKLNRRTMEALIRSGALDKLGPSRASMMASLDEAIKAAEQHYNNQSSGMMDLFADGSAAEAPEIEFLNVREWSDNERLRGEKETLGLYLTGHPIEQYERELKCFTSCRIAELVPEKGNHKVIAGLVIAMRIMKNKRGDKMCFVTLDDRSARIEISLFSNIYEEAKDLLIKDTVIVVEGEVSQDDYTGSSRMRVRNVMDMNHARAHYARRIQISISSAQAGKDFAVKLKTLLEPYRSGLCPLQVHYQGASAKAAINLGEDWRVRPDEALLNNLKTSFGTDNVQIVYR